MTSSSGYQIYPRWPRRVSSTTSSRPAALSTPDRCSLGAHDADGAAQRIIFECKHRKGSLEQNDMLAFKGAVDEVAYNSIPTTGVMVHLTGSLAALRAISASMLTEFSVAN